MTRIEWTDATWNPVVGCREVSPGCAHCYAARVAHRGMTDTHKGLTTRGPAGIRWRGRARVLPERLSEPLHWRKPRRVFVCSMSDLFHEDVPAMFIGNIFDVCSRAPQHVFQILTKRPERMKAVIGNAPPPPNVWLGVSCEDQQRADERIPLLLETPAAVRFVSCEPLLGPVSLTKIRIASQNFDLNALTGLSVHNYEERDGWSNGTSLDWVIVGGESGPGARPCDVGWIRGIVRQCESMEVPVFVKQLGADPYESHDVQSGIRGVEAALDALNHGKDPGIRESAWFPHPPWTLIHLPGGRSVFQRMHKQKTSKGNDPAEWPEDLRRRQWPQ